MSIETWLAFFVACWLISLSPGAGAVASMASGMNYGFARGYWNALGLQLALVLQIVIVAAGVGALLATSALAFALIKWFGVLYLLYLAIRQWRAPAQTMTLEHRPIGRPLSLVLRGFVINFSNPKAIIFILAVLPQFLDPGRPMLMQYLIMAVTMVAVDLVVMAGYTGLAAKALRLLNSPQQQRLLNRSFGVMFGVAAGLLATVRRV
ncbi:threonine transporter RhtB [Pseudomonas sp. G11-1]|uniref:Homoserine/homoserine lactone efflux protein n=1 Tax=Halopseudomonas bauzanensis TaxID=653930 RepID=A0A031MH33_9GAMM|nr:LysE family transporter [Halopseudomonas bauzanensis]MCO5784757.1 threonine transporter RhtB [Pseudomonas sp. G11-1]MCO5789140.1 threonine transporter RhtB [Pseudomonas sp. G11-2]EZQ19897.1 threonine transporter RhtB [Halopseudomonas bauzanensis]SER66861.1 homoserine/homoserine lactone efflux protein [Halopseudomonas bauzanensis]SFL61432.1 homoserine/homoserine lactone efflux protein [Halopseudomonas bauzanensis]